MQQQRLGLSRPSTVTLSLASPASSLPVNTQCELRSMIGIRPISTSAAQVDAQDEFAAIRVFSFVQLAILFGSPVCRIRCVPFVYLNEANILDIRLRNC